MASIYKVNQLDYLDAHQDEGIAEAKFKALRSEAQQIWNFEIVPGFFKQSHPETDELEFNYITHDFGLNRSCWEELISDVEQLHKSAKEGECFKVIFCARHGQGYHNLCCLKYGNDAWNSKWHSMETDGEIVWAPDPFLTELGEAQGRENHTAWKHQLSKGAPMPSAFYSSPFTRSCQTCHLTWEGLSDSKVTIKECIRETIGLNLCDKRSPKSVIEKRFAGKGFVCEEGFSEPDALYTDSVRESPEAQTLRIHGFLEFLFEKDYNKSEQDVFVSTTTHAGTIRSFLLASGHRRFAMGTGGMIPIVVKGTRI